MRRATLAIFLGLALAPAILPQEPAPTETKKETEPVDEWLGWKWANFGLLALGLGFMIARSVPALFEKRRQEIQHAIVDATKARQEAEAKAAEIEKRFAGLEQEVAKMRQEASAVVISESASISRETEQHLKKIQEQSVQEIALMSRAAREELRRYSAGLALDLSEQQLRSRVTKPDQDALVDGFLQDLSRR